MSIEDEIMERAKKKNPSRLRLPSRIDRSEFPVMITAGELNNLVRCIAYEANLVKLDAPRETRAYAALAAMESYGIKEICDKHGIDFWKLLKEEKAVR